MNLHVTGFVAYDGVGVYMGIVHSYLGFLIFVSSGLSLLRGYFIDSGEHARIYCTGVIEEDTIDGLDSLDSFGIKDG